ncbi:MAG: DUF3137 domain-containing protein [Planctomycetota bacterium]|jgi:hypothetical protein|nr:DUF3137 domain-containing protein [Planctomycetota bacterium]
MGLLGSIFGPSRSEIWAQVAADIGATHVEGGWFGPGDGIRYRHGDWEIVLDSYTRNSSGSNGHSHSHTYTRMRAPFINADGLRFEIYQESLFSGLGRLLGMQDIIIGDPVFDDAYVIKGNDEHQIRRLLDDPEVKRLISYQPDISLAIEDDEGWFGPNFGDNVDQLRFTASGSICDPGLLKDLFDLFATILERLVAIDSAYEADPGVRLGT